MARARNIKPGFFKNELLVELPFEYRLLFVGLWMLADREGRLEDRPTKIKMDVFPADAVDVNEGLEALHEQQFILRYRVDGRRFIQVLAWGKHQNPHVKENKSTIPAPDEHSASTVQSCNVEVIGTIPASDNTDASAGNSGTSRADSLIPDSLIPDSLQIPCPAKPPDVAEFKEKKLNGHVKPAKLRQAAVEVLEFLNEKTGHFYRTDNEETLKPIIARLKAGFTVGECKAVIARKRREWIGTDMEKYLRPETLFGAQKFAQYVGEVPPPERESEEAQDGA